MDNNVLSFMVPGPPHGQERPRVVRRGGRSITYDPEKSREYKDRVKLFAGLAMKRLNWYMAAGPVRLNILAFFPIPKSLTKKQRTAILEGKNKPTKKPDADNIAKAILDALSGLAYKDDAQIVQLTIGKYYCYPDEFPEGCVKLVLRKGIKDGHI